MNNKKKFILASSVMCMAAVGAVGALALSNANELKAVNPAKADGTEYTLAIDCAANNVQVNSDFTINTQEGNPLNFNVNGNFTKTGDGLQQSNENNGSIKNKDASPFQSLSSIRIEVKKSSEDDIFYLWVGTKNSPSDFMALSSAEAGQEISLGGKKYFQLDVKSQTGRVTITSITIKYTCSYAA